MRRRGGWKLEQLFFFQAEDGIRDIGVTGVQTCALPIWSRDWLKLKCTRAQELVIGGFTAPRGARTDLGALLVGHFEGPRLRYAGKVGTGFTRATLRELAADRKSTRLNSSHANISYAVFCLKKTKD